jgi:glycogen debranching enzyme
MTTALIRPELLYAWKGLSLLIVNTHGQCSGDQELSGYYYREARFLRTLRCEINGSPPWRCEAVAAAPDALAFTFIYPELTRFGGGGSGQSGDEESTDEHGIPHRALAVRASYVTALDGLHIDFAVVNHSTRPVTCELALHLDADFADIQEAHGGVREQQAEVERSADAGALSFQYRHPQLSYRTTIDASQWTVDGSSLKTTLSLAAQAGSRLGLVVRPSDREGKPLRDDSGEREKHWRDWRDQLTRVSIPGNRAAERVMAANVRDIASFAVLDGARDEWLTLQAGMPLYPALFGRDTLTAGWQAACLDRGQSLESSLTRLGRMQSTRVFDWTDEEPGRLPYQVRQGPLALLNLNPYAAYYADFASPLMFVISLAHLYSWTGDTADLRRHWDVARRILDWARTSGDKDGDGYLEYQTKSSKGTKNQGWKDSGDAIVYDDGRPVPSPIATCEIQGYWFAAQQLMAIMSAAMGAYDDARAFWASAADLKTRFNRDWWDDEQGSIALALDPDKRQVRAVTSNVGHCIACGIVDSERLPRVVGRLFAPDMFSGWGIRTLSSSHAAYNPLSYHLGTVWPVEQATIAFGLRRFGFDARFLDVAGALFDLAELYPEYRIPECVGGYPRNQDDAPGAYPRANTPQLWNASAFPLLIHTMLGLQPVAAFNLLVVDPVLPTWLPEIVVHGLRLGRARATLRFRRTGNGRSQVEVLQRHGTLHVVQQPPPESLSAGIADRFRALVDTVAH